MVSYHKLFPLRTEEHQILVSVHLHNLNPSRLSMWKCHSFQILFLEQIKDKAVSLHVADLFVMERHISESCATTCMDIQLKERRVAYLNHFIT